MIRTESGQYVWYRAPTYAEASDFWNIPTPTIQGWWDSRRKLLEGTGIELPEDAEPEAASSSNTGASTPITSPPPLPLPLLLLRLLLLRALLLLAATTAPWHLSGGPAGSSQTDFSRPRMRPALRTGLGNPPRHQPRHPRLPRGIRPH